MADTNRELWKKCAAFHGHECGGLAVGYQASMYATELLGLNFSEDEQVVCITENDACGVDAIQALLGCTLGKGNLLIKMRGKQAFSFYDRGTGRSVRLVLRDMPGLSKEEKQEKLMAGDYHELFDVKEANIELPEQARIFKAYVCEQCGERSAENFIHLYEGKHLCADCYPHYSRILP